MDGYWGRSALSESLTPDVPVVAAEQPMRSTSAGEMRPAHDDGRIANFDSGREVWAIVRPALGDGKNVPICGRIRLYVWTTPARSRLRLDPTAAPESHTSQRPWLARRGTGSDLREESALPAGLRGRLLSKAAPPSGLRLARLGSSDRQEFPGRATRISDPIEYDEVGPQDTTN